MRQNWFAALATFYQLRGADKDISPSSVFLDEDISSFGTAIYLLNYLMV